MVERSLSSATASVTVIDRQTIEASGAATLGELLAFVPGLDLTTNGSRGGLTVAQIRGGDPNFTLVLLDGVPLNDGTYQIGGVFNLEAMPTAAIERLEVVRGPLSSFYGSTGLAGAIHIFTRAAAPEGTDGAAELTTGDASLRGLSAELGGGRPWGSYFLSLGNLEESGRIAAEASELWNLQGRAELDLGGHAEGRLALRIASLEARDYPEASGGPALGSGELRQAESREASLSAELRLGRPTGLQHRIRAALYRHRLERSSPAILPLVPPSLEQTRFTRTRLGWAVSRERRAGRGEPAGRQRPWSLRASAGVDLERELGDNRSLLLLPDFLGGAVPGDYFLRRDSLGLFGEALIERGDWLVELGARVDAPDSAANQLSPRLGVSFRPGGGDLRLRASAGRAFKLPSFFALASPAALGGNPELRPETSLGADLGVEHSFPQAGLTAAATVFFNRFQELVDFDFASFSHVNRSQVEAQGAEAALAWRKSDALRLAANLTWQQVEDRLTGEPLRHRPRWTGGLQLDWRPRPELDLRLDGRAVSSALDEQIPVPERSSIRGRTIWGARAAWRLFANLRCEARIDNLLDERYETMIGFPGAGRSARLALRYRFAGVGAAGPPAPGG